MLAEEVLFNCHEMIAISLRLAKSQCKLRGFTLSMWFTERNLSQLILAIFLLRFVDFFSLYFQVFLVILGFLYLTFIVTVMFETYHV